LLPKRDWCLGWPVRLVSRKRRNDHQQHVLAEPDRDRDAGSGLDPEQHARGWLYGALDRLPRAHRRQHRVSRPRAAHGPEQSGLGLHLRAQLHPAVLRPVLSRSSSTWTSGARNGPRYPQRSERPGRPLPHCGRPARGSTLAATMADIPIALTCADYARVMPLATGEVKPEGIALTLILGSRGSWPARAEMLRRAV